MLDPKYLRNNIQEAAQKLATRGFEVEIPLFLKLEGERKKLQVQTQDLQSTLNNFAKNRRENLSQEEARNALEEIRLHKATLADKERQLQEVQEEIEAVYLNVPNLPHGSVPLGRSEKDSQVIRTWGEIPEFEFEVKDHVALGTQNQLLDFESATKIAGARFSVMYGELAQLQRALIQFMMDVHTEAHGYEEVYVPYIANQESLLGTGQLPKFADDQFAIKGDMLFYLIPTAEVPVTNLARDVIYEAAQLPKKYVCHTPCFRSEAGSYGRDVRGLIRQHQFEKVELVQMVAPEDSYTALEELTAEAETILQRLELSYRTVALCTGDLGFSAAKTYDIEVWIPSQKMYREISSCSNFEDFQARRLKARFRSSQTKKIELVHTLNGSALAVGRTLVALMENKQDAEGNIHLPHVLWPYMKGKKIIYHTQSK